MKNTTYSHYFNLIKSINNNAYLYVATYTEAKQKLIPADFKKLSNNIL